MNMEEEREKGRIELERKKERHNTTRNEKLNERTLERMTKERKKCIIYEQEE